jgi:hypothetical protein
MLAISMLRPEQIKSIDEQLKRLEGLNVSPEQKKAVRERWEKLKSQPVAVGPIRLRKHRNFRISGDVHIPPSPPVVTWRQRVAGGEKYIPPVLTPEQEREKRAEVRWHAQKGLWHTKRALPFTPLPFTASNEWREHTLAYSDGGTKHGRYSRAAKAERQYFRTLLKECR